MGVHVMFMSESIFFILESQFDIAFMSKGIA